MSIADDSIKALNVMWNLTARTKTNFHVRIDFFSATYRFCLRVSNDKMHSSMNNNHKKISFTKMKF